MPKDDPAHTYTLEDFVSFGRSDELTYPEFSVIRELNGVKFATYNIIDNYLDELKDVCLKISKDNITSSQIARYKYNPDLLAYDIYGTTQLDYIVMKCNGVIDPKEFDFHNKYLYLPKASVLQAFLSAVYNADYETLSTSISF
jgi:hypothetical protein